MNHKSTPEGAYSFRGVYLFLFKADQQSALFSIEAAQCACWFYSYISVWVFSQSQCFDFVCCFFVKAIIDSQFATFIAF